MSGETPAIHRPTITPPRFRTEGLPAELRETAAVHVAVEALRAAVDQLDEEACRDAAVGAWHATSVVRFFCSTYGGAVAGVRVNEDSFDVLRVEVPGDDVIDVAIAVGPDGTSACVGEGGGARPYRRPGLTQPADSPIRERRQTAISPSLSGTLPRLRH